MQAQLFKSGNSLAIRIPKTLWPAQDGAKVDLRREGDHLAIYPITPKLDDVMEAFRAFDPDFMSEGRENPEEIERRW